MTAFPNIQMIHIHTHIYFPPLTKYFYTAQHFWDVPKYTVRAMNLKLRLACDKAAQPFKFVFLY